MANQVRAKMRLASITLSDGCGFILKFQAGNQKDGDNKDWSQWTPYGHLELAITNPSISYLDYKVGEYYYVDFMPVVDFVAVPASE